MRRSTHQTITGNVTVACDSPTGSVKFRGTAISGLTITGKNASFLVTGLVYGKPANIPATAAINVTDNGSTNDMFGVTIKAGTKTVCLAGNAVKGSVAILVAGQPVAPAAHSGLLTEQLIAAKGSAVKSGAWPLLVLTMAFGAVALTFRRRRPTTR